MTLAAPALPAREADARPPAVLRAQGLRKAFGGHTVLHDATFELGAGHVVLLRGENGSGKTTLLNILSGLLAPDRGTIEYGAKNGAKTFRFGGRTKSSVKDFTPESLAAHGVGRTWQEVRLFHTLNLAENIACAVTDNRGEEPLVALFDRKAMRASETQAMKRATDALDGFELGERAGATPDAVSLGQSKRVAIARALAGDAQILLLDEPLAGLDAAGVSKTLDLLRQLSKEEGLTLIIVEHALNQTLVRPFVTHEWRLADGKLEIEDVAARSTPAAASARSGPDLPSWIAPMAKGAPVSVEKLPRGGMIVRIARADRGKTRLSLRHPVIHRGLRAVFGAEGDAADIDEIKLRRGDIVLLEAPNGWGKSTLLAACAGQCPVLAGAFEIAHRPSVGMPAHAVRRAGVVYIAASENAHRDLSVGESIKLSDADRTGDLIAGLRRGQKVASLSGGEKQRLALWCALTAKPIAHTYLMDEPLAFLDAAAIAILTGMIAARTDAAFLIAMPISTRTEWEIVQ